MEPCPSPFNLAQYVLRHANAQPDKVALAILGPARAERWSYQRLERAVRGIGTGLLTAGFKPGDRLLLRLENTVAFPLAYLAAISVGIIPAPTSAQLTTAELDKLTPLLNPAGTIAGANVALPSDPKRILSEKDLLALEALDPASYSMGGPNRLAYVIFTSGTSGTPRAVAHAHRAMWARQTMWDGWYGLQPQDRLLHAGAFNWTFTLGTGLMDPWSVGATALIPAQGVAPEMLPLLMARHDATLFAAAPGVIRKLLKHPERLNMPKLRHALCAGEHLSDTVRQAWTDATGTGLYDAFGMTECSTFLSASPNGAPALTPQPGRRIAVLQNGQPVQDTPGTIAVHKDDPGLMLGYVDGQSLDKPLTGDWFETGDQAQQDATGRFTYIGRATDLLNAGGFRVSPLEIEQVIGSLDGIDDVAIAEVTIKADTNVIVAFYCAPTEIAQTTLDAHATAQLARYKHPRAWVHVAELPRGPNGKLLRRALPQLWKDHHGQT